MTTVKAKLGDQIRRFNIEEGSDFGVLVSLLEKIFPQKEIFTSIFDLKYLDEENDYIPINSTEELKEAIRVAKSLQPPILRITLYPKSGDGIETSLAIKNDSKSTSEPISNWGKKLIEEDKNSLKEEHVVKFCGKPFKPDENEHSSQSTVPQQQGSTELHVKESIQVNNNDSKVKESVQIESQVKPVPKKKTIKETVEEYSEGLNIKSQQWSENIARNTLKYSEMTLGDTTPFAQNISLLSENISERLNDTLKDYLLPLFIPDKIYTEVLVEKVVHNVDEKFQETTKNMNEYSNNVDQKTSEYSTMSSICNDLSDGAMKLVDEKTIQVMNEVEIARQKVNNMQVNINMNANFNEAMIIDIENKVENLSTNTSDRLSDISENIAKNIMSI